MEVTWTMANVWGSRNTAGAPVAPRARPAHADADAMSPARGWVSARDRGAWREHKVR